MANGRRINDQQARQDHDLLIEIKAKLDGVLSLIAVKADAQAVMAIAADVADHEKRMRDLERRVVLAVGALAAIQFGVTMYVSFWK